MYPASFFLPSASSAAMRTWLCTENPPRQGALSSLLAPAQHAAAQFFRERVLAHEKRQLRAPKALEEQRLGHRWQEGRLITIPELSFVNSLFGLPLLSFLFRYWYIHEYVARRCSTRSSGLLTPRPPLFITCV